MARVGGYLLADACQRVAAASATLAVAALVVDAKSPQGCRILSALWLHRVAWAVGAGCCRARISCRFAPEQINLKKSPDRPSGIPRAHSRPASSARQRSRKIRAAAARWARADGGRRTAGKAARVCLAIPGIPAAAGRRPGRGQGQVGIYTPGRGRPPPSGAPRRRRQRCGRRPLCTPLPPSRQKRQRLCRRSPTIKHRQLCSASACGSPARRGGPGSWARRTARAGIRPAAAPPGWNPAAAKADGQVHRLAVHIGQPVRQAQAQLHMRWAR